MPEVRGTQSFVHTLSECWRRPSLTALEVLWRWAYGIPALLVLRYEWLKILREAPVDGPGAEWEARRLVEDCEARVQTLDAISART